ncbi:MAG: ArsI/CadI family heavy metal resistance metalloenzyme [Actinomycetota bacterium]|nr:ArsI/CadI family heavy metal resistance metalloenzyme [Actinomycetota bacterium]
MSRVQLALNVSNLDEAITFYTKLFGTQPAKIREGYANFAITEPPLKLVLIQGSGVPGTLNHLGVEVETTELVGAAITRLQGEGLPTVVEDNTTCCYAVQDKVWVHGPDAEPWEVYTVLADAPAMSKIAAEGESACCTPAPTAAVATEAACCTPAAATEPVAVGRACC